jgi:hypothetical protein
VKKDETANCDGLIDIRRNHDMRAVRIATMLQRFPFPPPA